MNPDEVHPLATLPLYQITGELAAALAEVDETGEIATGLADRLDSLQIARDTKLAGCSAARRNLVATECAIEAEIERLHRLKASVGKHVERLEDYLRMDLERLGETKFAHPALGFALRRNSPSVVIDDGTTLPEQFTRTKQVTTVSPDKAALMEAHKAGQALPEGVKVVSRTRLVFAGEK